MSQGRNQETGELIRQLSMLLDEAESEPVRVIEIKRTGVTEIQLKKEHIINKPYFRANERY